MPERSYVGKGVGSAVAIGPEVAVVEGVPIGVVLAAGMGVNVGMAVETGNGVEIDPPGGLVAWPIAGGAPVVPLPPPPQAVSARKQPIASDTLSRWNMRLLMRTSEVPPDITK